MGPGMIIQFEKSCEDALQLEIGDRKVAAGEAIKVGDKFGIRVTEIILPEERFNTIPGRMSMNS
jgi:flagellar motor switch/type III secretory pathway protein FliN